MWTHGSGGLLPSLLLLFPPETWLTPVLLSQGTQEKPIGCLGTQAPKQ